ncbi:MULTISPECIES: hypothetical protein [unclassified Cupriavidus]|uniref:hypothetical protein n=1 Tax=unclassified Cupriavidus TaxID=2640874 RepID=UPI00313F21B4
MAEIRLNFTISTEDHPELACLEAVGASRRGGRSSEVIRLLKLGAKADLAIRAIEDNRLAQAVAAGMLADGARPVVAPALGTVDPVASTRVTQTARSQTQASSPATTPEPRPLQPLTGPTQTQQEQIAPPTVPRYAFSQNPAAAETAPRRSGRSKASALMG